MVEELARRAGGHIRTLFATHYHELTGLEGVIPGVHNMNIAIREWNGDIVFLRRLIPGPADRSYGIEVAKLAGVPMPVVQRARDILTQLEQSRGKSGVCRAEAVLLPGLGNPVRKSRCGRRNPRGISMCRILWCRPPRPESGCPDAAGRAQVARRMEDAMGR